MKKILSGSAALLALALTSSAPAFAADLPSIKEAPAPPLPTSSDWRFVATINGWAPSVIANVGVASFPAASADVGLFKLLQHLNGAVPVSLVARNDTFIVAVDLFWSAASASGRFRKKTEDGVFYGVNANLHSVQTILTGFGGVRLPIEMANLSFYGIAGARYFGVDNTLGLGAPVSGFALSATQGKDWVNPIIGFAARYAINQKWFVDAEADIGGYSKNSTTWQTFAAVGYNWTQNISSTVGFRALYVDYRQANNFNGSFRFQETLLGPQVTINYAF